MDDEDSSSELVPVANFGSEQEFLVARALLEAAGIECFCSNVNFSRMTGIYAGMSGGITVRVRREELADARAILNDPGKPYLVR
ncbi:MAG: DUF2007 domain-containing protein [Candidatus Korobacteraceae bacterium]